MSIPGEESINSDAVLVPQDAGGRLRGILGAAGQVDVAPELHEDVSVADDASVRHCNAGEGRKLKFWSQYVSRSKCARVLTKKDSSVLKHLLDRIAKGSDFYFSAGPI